MPSTFRRQLMLTASLAAALATPALANEPQPDSASVTTGLASFIVNGRVAIADIPTKPGGPDLEVALWSRNLLDKTYVYRRDPSNRATFGDYGNFNMPRTFGIQLTARY